MSFDLVPADLILKIFHHLKFKDRVRLRGVNGQFRNASMESIAKMKSLVVDDDLVSYLIICTHDQYFSSLLESCSSTVESVDVSNRSCNKSILIALAEFVYPKLEHLKSTANNFNNVQIKRLISRNQNLRSVVLNLECKFEWPDDIVIAKMEKLEIQYANEGNSRPTIDLSPTLRPLIGKIPNLKRLMIHTEYSAQCRFKFSAQEFTELLASTPSLEKLKLDLSYIISVMDFKAAIPTWNLPRLTTLHINLWSSPNPASILRHFPASLPRLESFTSNMIDQIYDQDIKALSQLKYLRHLNQVWLDMRKTQIIEVITSCPMITYLRFNDILDVVSPESMVNFLTSTALIFRRQLEIELNGSDLKDALEGMKNSGPAVTYHRGRMTIRYNP